jgi:hypothetical protein
MLIGHNEDSPVQPKGPTPVPVYPEWQAHEKLPSLFVQSAAELHGLRVAHSLRSFH